MSVSEEHAVASQGQRASAAFRASLAKAVDQLIGILDDLDDEADAEPWLGWNDSVNQRPAGDPLDPSTRFAAQDLELECEDEGAQCEDEGAASGDDEPSLGAPALLGVEGRPSQDFWCSGCSDADLEEQADPEPSMCGLTVGSGDDHDIEADDADSEPSLCGLTADTLPQVYDTAAGEISMAVDLEGQCEDEGFDCDGEPDPQACSWQDEGDQTHLRLLPVFVSGKPMVGGPSSAGATHAS